MQAPRTHLRGRLSVLLALIVSLAGLQALTLASPASANITGTDIVIKEVYGAGGNGGAVLNADFVELFNPAGSAKSLDGLTIQYRSAAGGVGGTQALPNVSIPSGGSYLI